MVKELKNYRNTTIGLDYKCVSVVRREAYHQSDFLAGNLRNYGHNFFFGYQQCNLAWTL